MIKIKKTIDIILIAAAIVVVVVLAERIIPFNTLNASIDSKRNKNIQNFSNEEDVETWISGEIKLNMVPDERSSKPAENIFILGFLGDENNNKNITPGTNPGLISDSEEKDEKISELGKKTGEAVEEAVEETSEVLQETSVLKGDDVDFSNSENFRIEIDLTRQRVIVFHKDDILREMICSGGAPESPTPLGEYVTSQKIEYSWVERFGVGAYYWVRFFENYLIHSIPFNENDEMIIEEYEKLGNPVSHGCVRLSLEEAKWLYETLPLGVKVLIY